MFKSRLITAAGFVAGSVILSASASAACANGVYCTQNTHSTAAQTSGYSMLRQVNPIGPVSTRYSAAPIAIADQPAVNYAAFGSGSGYRLASRAGTPASMPGMGAGESLVRVDCPVTVDAPAGSRVLDCYSLQQTQTVQHRVQYVQPAPVVRAYQVVRPVIGVPYPVPVMVPNACGPIYDAPSRYGSSYGYGRCGQ